MVESENLGAYISLRDNQLTHPEERLKLFQRIIESKDPYVAFWTLERSEGKPIVLNIPPQIERKLRNIILERANAHVAAWTYKEIPGWSPEEKVRLRAKIKPSWIEWIDEKPTSL